MATVTHACTLDDSVDDAERVARIKEQSPT